MRISLPFPGARDRAGAKPASQRSPRWLALPVALLLIAVAVFWWLPSRLAPTAATTTATVGQGDLTIVVTGSGSVAAARTVELPFQQSGTVTAVDVKVGDQVTAGQTLATIDPTDLQLQLQQAQASLRSAEAQLAQAKGGSATPQDLASAKAQLDSATAQLAKTKTGAVTDVQSARANLASAQAKLDALKNPTQLAHDNAQRAVDQAQMELQNTRASASQAKTNAELALHNSVNSLTQAQSRFSTAQQNWQHVQETGTDPNNPTTTDASGNKKANKLNDAQRQQYYDTFVQAQASLGSAQNAVTQAQVAYDTARQSEVTNIQQAEAALKAAQQELDALLNPDPNDLAQAQAAVTQAQTQLTNLQKGGTQASLASAEAQVTQAQVALDKLTAPATDAELASAEANVLQAQANVDTARRNLDQARLTAPFDGVISAVTIQVGASSGAGSSSSSSSSSGGAAITLVDRSKLHIEISLSETDAAKVQVGQPVKLTFDAMPNVTLEGKVATVAPAATVSQNVVTYPVQVEFDPGSSPVKVGMSATADIQIQQINNATLVPSRAVQTSGSNKSVTVLQGDQRIPVTVQVETGATSNGQTEILSCVATGGQCLRPGDLLSIPSASTTTSTTQGANRGGFGGPRFGGPPGFGG
ncbi:MAG TPA: efflux RND transporter periplasmic adaptor subunit [Roseiflexaceae bacterium]|nr:efflux RND transporter periplasmic adaptor subunit [Roseiflexaceae bacterium]